MKSPLSSGGRVELFARRGHEALPGSRDGAGVSEADHVVAGSGDYGDQRAADAALAVGDTNGTAMTGCMTGGGAPRVPGRVAVATVEQVRELYGEKYFDCTVRHFHEKLREEHGIGLSYT